MSAQTVLEARLRGRDDGLVGTLNAAEQRARGAAAGLKEMAGAARQNATATSAAAASDRAAAAAAREVERARKDQERAARAAARAEQQAANEIARAQNRLRAGQFQLGQQAQDFLIQWQAGTPLLTAFSQQASQAQGAIALMGGEVDKNSSRLAKFASIMGGPVGIAIGVAIPLVTMLAAKLFENADASAAAEAGADGLAAAQTVLGQVFDTVSGKLKTQNELLIINARLQAISLRAEAVKAEANARSVTDSLIKPGNLNTAQLYGQFVASNQYGADPKKFTDALANRRQLTMIAEGVSAGRIKRADAVKMTDAIDFEGTGFDQSEVVAAFRDGAVAELNRRAADLIDKSLESGALAKEFRTKGPAGRKPRSGAGAARALENFGDGAAEKIARISDAYNPAPQGLDKAFTDLRTLDGLIEDLEKRRPPSFEKLIAEAKDARTAVVAGIADPLDTIQQRLVPLPDGITKAKAAIKELDGVIAVLSDRKPPNWEQLVARAQELKAVAIDTVSGPLNDMLRASREQQAVQLLVLQGREREAEVLARIQQLTRDQGPLTADQRRSVEQMVALEERINDLLQKRQDIIAIYMSSIGDLRGALEDLFSGGSAGDFLKDTEKLIKRFRGSMTVEAIFGDSLRALEKRVRGKTPLDREVEALTEQVDSLETEAGRSSAALKMFTDAVGAATADLNRAKAPSAIAQGAKSFLGVFKGASEDAANPAIVVNGSRKPSIGGTLMREQTDFLREMARTQYEPLAKLFDEYLGGDFFRKLSPVFEGAYAGFFTAGPVGGILGAVKELPGLPDKLKSTLGGAFQGAQTGTMVAGIGKSLGLKMSTTGSQIGGAVGSFLPIPGGEIVGSIAGGLLGGLFKKARSAGATITGVDDYSVGGKDKKNYGQAEGLAGSVTGGLQKIADALGASVGSFYTTIGVRDGDYRVNTTGSSLKTGSGARNFNDDEAGAIAFAIADAIGDGAIKGLSAAMQQALRSSTDIDKAVQEALKVREVEEILGGLGNALERQFREFEDQAKERVRIATQYGFDVSKIEARNAEDRAKMVEQILSTRVGSLQQLLDDMKFGDLFEGSAADRRSKLLTEIAAAKADAEKGVDGAADKLADLTRKLVETSRDAYGTAGGEYASDRSNAISTAEKIIAAENERIRAAQQASVDTSKAMQTQNQLTNETNDILSEMRAILRSNGGAPVGAALSGIRLDVNRYVDIR
jgi:hypothetical protein